MFRETIKVYLRLKPCEARKVLHSEITLPDAKRGGSTIFTVNENISEDDFKSISVRQFSFANVFDIDTNQENIFKQVAVPVMDNALSGVNGTIFVYGQSGSGKTYTMTGGSEVYLHRGLIPRAISYLFKKFGEIPDNKYSLSISYMELYNDVGYDLISEDEKEVNKLEDLRRITTFEDTESKCIHLRNLSMHPCPDAERALSLLFQGDTNRVIAETPLNMASTRSHCIFTLHISTHLNGSITARSAKLHLVDLAGSERVCKSNLTGVLLTEAKCINLSLHYLEQVIIALTEKHRTHVPYRNSMLTMILRDSLGGNCLTSMIANISTDFRDRMETLSTCRFAQRVAMITNEIAPNEEVNTSVLIENLKAEIESLKSQLAILKGSKFDCRNIELKPEEKDLCHKVVKAFLTDDVGDYSLLENQCTSSSQIMFAFKVAREYFQVLQKESGVNAMKKRIVLQPYDVKAESQMKELLKQRDSEISVLVNMLKKFRSQLNRKDTNFHTVQMIDAQPNLANTSASNDQTVPNRSQNTRLPEDLQKKERMKIWRHRAVANWLSDCFGANDYRLLDDYPPMDQCKSELFEIFKGDHPLTRQILDHKAYLRQQYAEAKQLGKMLKKYKETIEKSKSRLSQSHSPDLLSDLAIENKNYRDNYNKLSNIKAAIEHSHHNMQNLRIRLVQEFETWFEQERLEAANLSTNQSQCNITDEASPPEDNVTAAIECHHELKSNNNEDAEPCRFPMTGDPFVDADIAEFIRARKSMKATSSS